MEQFTQEDLQNISKLITRVADIKGTEALAVAVLQQKIASLITPVTPVTEAPTAAKDSETK